MRQWLEQSGVAPSVIIEEPHSTTTYENAIYSKKIALERSWKHVLVVTSSFHQFRSDLVFKSVFQPQIQVRSQLHWGN